MAAAGRFDAKSRQSYRHISLVAAAITLAAIVVSVAAPNKANGYNGLSDDLSNYRWSGTIETDYSQSDLNPGVPNRYDRNGSLQYSNLRYLTAEEAGTLQVYGADVVGAETQETYFCDPLMLGERLSAELAGPYEGVPGYLPLAVGVASRPEGFFLRPYLLYVDATDFDYPTCFGPGSSESTAAISVGGLTAGWSANAQRLTQDLDPDPYRLVGTTEWNEANMPVGLEAPDDGAYRFSVSYDLQLVTPTSPPECSDGVSNDFDGLVDYPLDPGCSGPDDPSELGTNECDNGIDDDGDGGIDYPADTDCASPFGAYEKFDCRSHGEKRRAELRFKGKVALKGLPDAHLFDFEPTLIYCFGAGQAEILSANSWSFIDAGADTAALELLGFKVGYDANAQAPVHAGNLATFNGDFEVSYDLLSLGKKFGFGTKVVKQRLSKRFSKQLAKKLKRYGYKSPVKSALLRAAYDIRKQGNARYDEWAAKAVRKSPRFVRPLVQNLAKRLGNQVAARLKVYERNVAALVSTDRLARKSADEITTIMVDAAFRTFSSAFERTFSVWTPLISAQARPDGRLDISHQGFRNSFLTVDYSAQETVIP